MTTPSRQGRAAQCSYPTLRVLKEMKSFSDVFFRGTGDPAIAERWLSAVEFCFRSLGVMDSELMANVAPNLFTGEAIDWWMGRQSLYPNEILNWTEFRRIFLEKHVSVTYRNHMKMEFLRLEQGTDSVSVYVQKFDTHARYAPEYVSTETDKI